MGIEAARRALGGAAREGATSTVESFVEVVGHDSLEFDEVSIPVSDDEKEWMFLDAADEVSIPLSQAEAEERAEEPEEPEEPEVLEEPEEPEVLDTSDDSDDSHDLGDSEDLKEPEEVEPMQRDAAEEANESGEAALPLDTPAAELLAGAPLRLGSEILAECEGFRGDITKQWAAAFEAFPRVAGAFCLGRLLVLPGGPGAGAAAVARAVVINNGCIAWPAATCLRIVAGDAYGFGAMHVGALAPGQGADLALDVVLPTDAEPGCGKRSAWVLTDGYGEPFGPLLVLEVVWA